MNPARIFWTAGALLAGVTAACMWPPLRNLPPDAFFNPSQGESLIHGVALAPGAGARAVMPLKAVAIALPRHFGAGSPVFEALGFSAAALAIFIVGGILGSPAAGLLCAAALGPGAALLLWRPASFLFLILLTAGALAWRAQKPTPFRTLVLALVLGVSLLYRSVLFLFPPLLACYLYMRAPAPRRGPLRVQLFILCLVPYLFLLPWIALNRATSGRLIPFEKREAECNIITGALGLVPTIDPSWRPLFNDPPDLARPGALTDWALKQIAAHPGRYLFSCASRLVYVLTMQPWLFLGLGLVLWFRRKREDLRQLGLFVGYYVAVHCLMSVEQSYFFPLWPLLWLLATFLIPWGRKEAAPGSGTAMLAAVTLVLASAAALEWRLTQLAWADTPGAETSLKSMQELARREPGDCWLSTESGRRSLIAGDKKAARTALRAALVACPTDAQALLLWSSFWMAEGRPGPALTLRPAEFHYPSARAFQLRGIWALRRGRVEEGKVWQGKAWAAWHQETVVVRRETTDLEHRARARLEEAAYGLFAGWTDAGLAELGVAAPERLRLLTVLPEPGQNDPGYWMTISRLAASTHDAGTSQSARERARSVRAGVLRTTL